MSLIGVEVNLIGVVYIARKLSYDGIPHRKHPSLRYFKGREVRSMQRIELKRRLL